MALTQFPVTGTFQAVISDSSDAGGESDVQNISSTVWFTPSVQQVYSASEGKVIRLAPVRARTNPDDGMLRTIDGNTVSLISNSAALGLENLYWTVTFSNVVYDRAEREITSFTFEAPQDSTPVDLATVARVVL
ncbi:hypothetical protein BN970_01348 [Mycolicibacterium conceptionense]|uniref:Uncharacterized protein n=1 Tax=Mycolicibacterium conceptionense TaxID=451644 RepID=A0A0U1D4S5_9MYCO|nr:hypothetical protein [Mycolicibacterium conceptionense]ORV20948.1 hypothetical protein AWB98_01220 [Mycolicibacterium conceptionense]CQD07184.1 hypothetical protein BN970_01348 [Mycolicibacterium conceptionense]